MTQRLYTERAILIATFIGGALAGGFLIAQNFSTFSEPTKRRLTWLITGSVLLLVFGSAFVPALDAVPGMAYSFVLCLLARFFAKKFQGSRIQLHQASGGAFYSTGRAVAVGCVSLLLMLSFILGLVYLVDMAGDV